MNIARPLSPLYILIPSLFCSFLCYLQKSAKCNFFCCAKFVSIKSVAGEEDCVPILEIALSTWLIRKMLS